MNDHLRAPRNQHDETAKKEAHQERSVWIQEEAPNPPESVVTAASAPRAITCHVSIEFREDERRLARDLRPPVTTSVRSSRKALQRETDPVCKDVGSEAGGLR